MYCTNTKMFPFDPNSYKQLQTMNRSKLLFKSIHEIKAYMSSSTKFFDPKGTPNHYDTLKIKRDSTQEDIKSAYYDLSKKYHPDINTSSDAKKQFQQISDAYEVLGNFHKRKLYDRDFLARGNKATTARPRTAGVYETMDEDPLAGFHKSRASKYDAYRASASQPHNFDFDAWTKAHYGHAFRRSLKDRDLNRLRKERTVLHQKEIEQNRASMRMMILISGVALTLMFIHDFVLRDSPDKNMVYKRSKE